MYPYLYVLRSGIWPKYDAENKKQLPLWNSSEICQKGYGDQKNFLE